MAGIAGGFSRRRRSSSASTSFAFPRSGDLMIMVVLGGAGRLCGALVGTVVFMVVQDYLAGLNPATGSSGWVLLASSAVRARRDPGRAGAQHGRCERRRAGGSASAALLGRGFVLTKTRGCRIVWRVEANSESPLLAPVRAMRSSAPTARGRPPSSTCSPACSRLLPASFSSAASASPDWRSTRA